MHGDIGYINKDDIVIYLSNSGNTIELINIATYIKKKCDNVIGIFTKYNFTTHL